MKYENVYLKGYANMRTMEGLAQYFAFYNKERPDQSLGYQMQLGVYASSKGGGATIVDKCGGAREEMDAA